MIQNIVGLLEAPSKFAIIWRYFVVPWLAFFIFLLFFSYLHKNYGLLSITEACDTVKRHGIHAVFDSAFCGCLYRLTGGLPVRIDISASQGFTIHSAPLSRLDCKPVASENAEKIAHQVFVFDLMTLLTLHNQEWNESTSTQTERSRKPDNLTWLQMLTWKVCLI